MRSSPLVLLLLIGVQAVLNMEGGGALGPGAANHRSGQQPTAAGDRLSERHALQDKKSIHQRGRKAHRTSASPAQDRSSSLGNPNLDTPLDSSIPEVDPKLFSKRRYRSSPRVVFSDTAPSHSVWEGEEAGAGTGGPRGARVRRQAGKQRKYSTSRGEFSVCDSIDVWVTNLTRATDIQEQEVIVLPSIKIGNETIMKQFFFETTCRTASTLGGPAAAAAGGKGQGGGRGAKAGGGSKSGCRGIDSRHWNSYCTNTHTYVRALTSFRNQTAWRLIRINAACVCVLSRKYWKH